jgi:hypothetical protein
LGFLISAKYLLPLTVAFLAITAVALGFRASRRHGYGPLWMGLAAAGMILTGKFYLDAAQATYAGIGLLIAASVWNSWPRPSGHNPLLLYLRSGRSGLYSTERARRKDT